MTLGVSEVQTNPTELGRISVPTLFPQDAQTLPFTPLVEELYCLHMDRRKQNVIFLKMKAELLPERER